MVWKLHLNNKKWNRFIIKIIGIDMNGNGLKKDITILIHKYEGDYVNDVKDRDWLYLNKNC